jgi:hypothetical protein
MSIPLYTTPSTINDIWSLGRRFTSSSQMRGEELGPPLHEIRETLLQCRRDAGVQFLPFRAQQRAVSGVLDQRMFEEIGGFGTDSAAEQRVRSRLAAGGSRIRTLGPT